MKVKRLDFDIWVEGVHVEEHRVSSIVGHVEPICQNITVNIFKCFLQCDDVPLACDLFLKSTFFSTSRSWIPVVVMFRFRVRALLVCESNAFMLTRATRTAGIRHPGIIRIPDDAFCLSHTCRCRHHVFESFSVFLSRHRRSSAVNFAGWAPCRVTKNFKVNFEDIDVAGSSVVTVIRLGRSRFKVRQLWDDQHRFRPEFVNSLKIEFISSLRIEFINQGLFWNERLGLRINLPIVCARLVQGLQPFLCQAFLRISSDDPTREHVHSVSIEDSLRALRAHVLNEGTTSVFRL